MKNKSAPQSILVCLLIAVVFVGYSSPVRGADTTTWTGNGDGTDWFDEHNWSDGVPDCANFDAFINNGGKVAVSGNTALARTLTLGLNAGDSGEVVVSGGSALYVCGTAEVLGNLNVGYADRGNLSIINGGYVSSRDGHIGALGGEFLTSNGVVTVSGANSIWIIEGKLLVGENGTGLLSVTNGGTVMVHQIYASAAIIVGTSGTLTGGGTVIAAGDGAPPARRMVVTGTLAPSGTLHIGDNSVVTDLNLQSTATMVCNVTPSAADNVNGSGTATLGGRLLVTMTGNFLSGPTRFTLLHSEGGLASNTFFSSVSITYPTNQDICPHITYDYTAKNVYLDTDCP